MHNEKRRDPCIYKVEGFLEFESQWTRELQGLKRPMEGLKKRSLKRETKDLQKRRCKNGKTEGQKIDREEE